MAPRAPHPPAVAHVPTRSTLGTLLDHPTSLAAAGQMTPGVQTGMPPETFTGVQPLQARHCATRCDVEETSAICACATPDLVHAVDADTPRRRRSTAIRPTVRRTSCQQCRAIHNFHRFIHSPSAAETPIEPPNLWAYWKLLCITLRGYRSRSTGRWTPSEIGCHAKFRTHFQMAGAPCRPFG